MGKESNFMSLTDFLNKENFSKNLRKRLEFLQQKLLLKLNILHSYVSFFGVNNIKLIERICTTVLDKFSLLMSFADKYLSRNKEKQKNNIHEWILGIGYMFRYVHRNVCN
jgi:hypothetical protein